MRNLGQKNKWILACAAAVALGISSVTVAAPGDETPAPPVGDMPPVGAIPPVGDMGHRPPPPPPMRSMTPPVPLEGTVIGYNHAGRGEIDGFVMTVRGKTVQVNLPPTIGAMVSSLVPQDQLVKILASKMDSIGDHDVYEFRGLDDGKAAETMDPPLAEKKDQHVEGTIKSLNYARRGEVDGALLDTGDFVHIGPREAEGLKLKVGDKLTADGPSLPMIDGKNAIDADKVNGTTLNRPPRPDGGPGGRGGPHGGPGGMGRGPNGPDQDMPPAGHSPAVNTDQGMPPGSPPQQ